MSPPRSARRAALDRLYDHYAWTTAAAMRLAYPYTDPHPPEHRAGPLERVTPTPPLPTAAAALAWLDTEQPNLLAAAGHAANHQRPDHTTDQSAALHHHLHSAGQYTGADALHRQALAAAETVADHHARQTARITALNNLGDIYRMQDRYGEAAQCHTRALRSARAAGHRAGAVRALTGLGWIHRLQGRNREAGDCYTEALRIARDICDRYGEIIALTGIADVQYAQGRYGAAAGRYQQVLDLATELDSRNWQFEGRFGLGRTAAATGQPAQARTAYEHALALARDLEQPTDRARAHDGLAHAGLALSHPDRARQHWQQALHILTTLGIPAADDVTATDIRAHLAAVTDIHPSPDHGGRPVTCAAAPHAGSESPAAGPSSGAPGPAAGAQAERMPAGG